MSENEMKKCPYCGGGEYFTKESYKGKCKVYTRFDGKEAENGDMYAYAEHKTISNYAYCSDCKRKLFKIKN